MLDYIYQWDLKYLKIAFWVQNLEDFAIFMHHFNRRHYVMLLNQ